MPYLRNSDGKLVDKATYLTYLEQCALTWEKNKQPEEAARVRRRAARIKAEP